MVCRSRSTTFLQVFTTVVTKLLEPLLTLRSLILTQTSEDDAVRSQIKRYIEDIVLHSLFHPDHLFEYSLAFSLKQNVVTPAPSGKPPRSYKRLFLPMNVSPCS